MESQTSSYDTPVQETVISFDSHDETEDVHFINTLLMQLIRSLDIEELLTIFHNTTQKAIPLVALSLITEDTSFNRGNDTFNHRHEVSLALSGADASCVSTAPSFKYRLSRALSLAESALLTKIHHAVSHLVIHALSFSKLTKLATKDELTGLGNRTAFNEDSVLLHQASLRKHRQFALLVLDLDNFKAVNDNYGHDEGDNVLVVFTRILQTSLRVTEKAYRFGGDEFCCLLDTSEQNTVDLVAQRILQNAENNLLLQRHNVSVSIGGTLSTLNEQVIDTFKRADKALYQVKQQGKQGYLLG